MLEANAPIRLCMEVVLRVRSNTGAAYRNGLVALVLLIAAPLTAFAQASSAEDYRVNAALNVDGINTQFPSYADNAAGMNLAVFYQKSPLIGIQAKGGGYFYSARFKLAPITAGYRVGRPYSHSEITLWNGWYPFAYAGAGVSYAQDSGAGQLTTPSAWYFAMQGSAGIDHQFRYFTWRVAEVSWTETNTSVRSLRSIGVGTGLVFHLLR
jgi:hypothetical protein